MCFCVLCIVGLFVVFCGMGVSSSDRFTVLVFSHLRRGGGNPLDSFWFSRGACADEGVDLRIMCTNSRNFLRCVWWLFRTRRVVFDGRRSLLAKWGPFLLLKGLFWGKRLAVYWHETAWFLQEWPFGRRAVFEVGWLWRKPLWVLRRLPAYWFMRSRRVRHFHVSEAGVATLKEVCGVAAEQIWLLNNITDDGPLLRFDLPLFPERKRVIAVGSAHRRKRPDLFIAVAARVLARMPDVEFVLLGRFAVSGYNEVEIGALLDGHGVDAERVRFVGFQADPAAWVAESSVFLHTAEDDPMPKVIMEALGLGKPVVAYRVGGIPEIAGDFGVFCDFGEVEGMADGVIAAFGLQDEGLQLARRDRYVGCYSPASFGRRFREVAVGVWGG